MKLLILLFYSLVFIVLCCEVDGSPMMGVEDGKKVLVFRAKWTQLGWIYIPC
jgi:hypothetical protein